MRTAKTSLCIAIWIFIGWLCLHKLSQGIHDENLIYRMPQSTYDEIIHSFTSEYGFHPSDHQIATYYQERYGK